MTTISKMTVPALALAATLGCASTASAFDPYAAADPAAVIRAFQETCAKGFPDVDAVERNARAAGWLPSEMRALADATIPNLPKAFHKDGQLLFLTHTDGGTNEAVCQIGGSGQTRLTAVDLAALLTPALNAGSPVFEKAKNKDVARYTTGPGLSVEASIDIYRKSRTISIIARKAR